MIIVKLMGGLGNQMFQYSFARFLSLKFNHDIKLDINFLLDRKPVLNFTYRDFELNNFNFNYEFVKDYDLNLFKFNLYNKFITKFRLKSSNLYLREGSSDISKIPFSKNIYLDGFWQNEKYFLEIRETLLEDFNLTNYLVSQHQYILNENFNHNTISVHIRRGDYITNDHNNSYHGTCSIDYYLSSINYIKKYINNPKFLFFSDDIEWVIENFNTLNINKVFITNEISKNSISDLFLMTQCRHNIIANSTFSWWGAWLNNNTSKIVIAPSKWTNVDNSHLENIIPNTWIRF